MTRTLLVLGTALAAALGQPAAAQTFQAPRSLAEKYSDTGIKPATGRSGSAALEVRALLDHTGATQLEVTTGRFEGAAARGSIAKAQVKVFDGVGHLLQTDNYRKTLSGEGYASFVYDLLQRGHVMQVQANVTGIDPNRTDVVTVSAAVMRRPDLAAMEINAPEQAIVNTPVSVSGVISELNGDVGARGTCRLLADGVEIDAIAGIWVDAGSTVTCQFLTHFETPGTRQLAIQVGDSAPADDLGSNNTVTGSIAIVDANRNFQHVQVYASHNRYGYEYRYPRSFRRHDTGEVSNYLHEYVEEQDWRYYQVYGRGLEAVVLDSATITLRGAMDGVPLPLFEIRAVDLPATYYGYYYSCRYGNLVTGEYAQLCVGPGYSDVYAGRQAGRTTYRRQEIRSGVYGTGYWVENYSNVYGDPINIGSTFAAEIELGTPSATLRGSATASINTVGDWNNVYENYCWSNSWYDGTESGCNWARQYQTQRWGSAVQYY